MLSEWIEVPIRMQQLVTVQDAERADDHVDGLAYRDAALS
jgi:hypothetical protein